MNTIVSYPERGYYGDNKYRGNATGKLLLDLHKVYGFNLQIYPKLFSNIDRGKWCLIA